MRFLPFSAALLQLSLALGETRIVLSNDDGWAEINIRAFYNRLTDAGNCVLISAPAENKSGTGSSDAPPTTVDSDGCEFGSCPPNSPAVGSNTSMPRFNYVNSFPATSMRYGIQNLSKPLLGGAPDLAVAGPNVGANLGIIAQISGTVGAATEAVKEGVPAIAFSGTSGEQTAWNVSATPNYAEVYAELSAKVTEALLACGGSRRPYYQGKHGKPHQAKKEPYLAKNIWLNVNYGVSNETACTSAKDFRFVLSRINADPLATDVTTCGNGGHLPSESDVVATAGCYASISVGHADTKLDATAAEQKAVLRKLRRILSCLPQE